MDYKKIFGWLFMISGALFMFGLLVWTLSTLQALSNLSHKQEMERLELEKEIALIKINNISEVSDGSYAEPCFILEEDSTGYKHTEYFEYCYTVK